MNLPGNADQGMPGLERLKLGGSITEFHRLRRWKG